MVKYAGHWMLTRFGTPRAPAFVCSPWSGYTRHGSAGLRRIRNGSRKGHTRPQHVFFKGEATAVEKEASFSFAEIKQQLGAGQWLRMLPVLLAIGGFLGLFLFGSVIAFARA